MNIQRYLRTALVLSVLFISLCCFAQHTRVIHQSFEIDSLEMLQLELVGEYEISFWEGNTILTETKIELSDASPNILKYFVKMGRYDIEMKSQPLSANIKHLDYHRKPIYTQEGQAWENVKLVVYIPDVFSSEDNKTFKRMLDLKAQAN